MSEYQYYEFRAIDRFLTEEEQRAVEKLLSRVDLSASHAILVYNYSPGPPEHHLSGLPLSFGPTPTPA
jgi:hypothetical protein